MPDLPDVESRKSVPRLHEKLCRQHVVHWLSAWAMERGKDDVLGVANVGY